MAKSKLKSHSTADFFFEKPKDLSGIIGQMYLGKSLYNEVAGQLLERSGWEFEDPAHKMGKSATEVRDYLKQLSEQVGLFSDLNDGRRNLLKMICDAYLRWRAAMKNSK